MKKWYAAFYFLMLLSVVITAVFVVFMPDRVPMHYNLAGEIDRFGSKYENLLMPLATVLVGTFLLLIAKYFHKKQEPQNEKVILSSGVVLLVLFNVLFGYFLWRAASYIPEVANEVSVESIYQIASIGIGIMLIVFGYLMPQTSLNSVAGLRTTWSMKNERVWGKSQRFGGIAMSICGAAIIITSLFIKGFASLFVTIGFLVIGAIISVVASYRIYLNDK